MGCGDSKLTPKTSPVRTSVKNYLPNKGPLSAQEFSDRVVCTSKTKRAAVEGSDFTVEFAAASFRGYYPFAGMQNKPNQDAYFVPDGPINGRPVLCFGVFDGHGEQGHECAQFAAQKAPEYLAKSFFFDNNIAEAFKDAMLTTNEDMHASKIDDRLSGTTAAMVLLRGRTLIVSNVGDSRIIMCTARNGQHDVRALTSDHTPYRQDESDRVKSKGAMVLSYSQMEGRKDNSLEVWSSDTLNDAEDEPYVWYPTGGSAFTRSLGDQDAKKFGIIADPEVISLELTHEVTHVILASDGIFEFLDNAEVADLVTSTGDLHVACYRALARAYRNWLVKEKRTDDITIVVLSFDWSSSSGARDKTHSSGLNRWSLASMPEVERDGSITDNWLKDRSGMWAPLSNSSLKPSEEVVGTAHAVKTSTEAVVIKQGLLKNQMLDTLTPHDLNQVIDMIERYQYTAGQPVFKIGDVINFFFLVHTGEFEVWGIPRKGEKLSLLRVVGPNETFGLLGLLTPVPAKIQVVARVDGELWQLHGPRFRKLMGDKVNTDVLGLSSDQGADAPKLARRSV